MMSYTDAMIIFGLAMGIIQVRLQMWKPKWRKA